MVDEIDYFVLKALVTELLYYVGSASCHGNKCRLPHCQDCNTDEESYAAHERLISLISEINTILNKDS